LGRYSQQPIDFFFFFFSLIFTSYLFSPFLTPQTRKKKNGSMKTIPSSGVVVACSLVLSIFLASSVVDATSCTTKAFSPCRKCEPGIVSGSVKRSAVGVAGVTVELLDGGHGLIASKVTDVNGEYKFVGFVDMAECGNYIVKLADTPFGYNQISPATQTPIATVLHRNLVTLNFELERVSCNPGSDKKILFNSGYNYNTNTPMNVNWGAQISDNGPRDQLWTLTEEADSSSGITCDTLKAGEKATTTRPEASWDSFPNAEWINGYPQPQSPPSFGYHAYSHCFCLHEGFNAKEASMDIQVLADEHVALILNGMVLWDSRECRADGQPNLGYHSTGRPIVFGANPYPPGIQAASYDSEMFKDALRTGSNCLTLQIRNQDKVFTTERKTKSAVAVRGGIKIPSGQCCVDIPRIRKVCQAVYNRAGCFEGCAGVCKGTDQITTTVGELAQEVLLPSFSSVDEDHNGLISPREMENAPNDFDEQFRVATEAPPSCDCRRHGNRLVTYGSNRGPSRREHDPQDNGIYAPLRSILDKNEDGFISIDEYPGIIRDPLHHPLASIDDKDCQPLDHRGNPIDSDIVPSGITESLWNAQFSGRCGCGEDIISVPDTIVELAKVEKAPLTSPLEPKLAVPVPSPPSSPEEDECCTPQFTYGGELGWVFKQCSGECENPDKEKCKPIDKLNRVMDMSLYGDMNEKDEIKMFNARFKNCSCTDAEPPTSPCPTAMTGDGLPYCPGRCPLTEKLNFLDLDVGDGERCVAVDRAGNEIDASSMTREEYIARFYKCSCPEPSSCPTSYTDIQVNGESVPDVPVCDARCPLSPTVDGLCQPVDANGVPLSDLHIRNPDLVTKPALELYLSKFKKCVCPTAQEGCQPKYRLVQDFFIKVCGGGCVDDSNTQNKCVAVDKEGVALNPFMDIPNYIANFHKCSCPACRPSLYNPDTGTVMACAKCPNTVCNREIPAWAPAPDAYSCRCSQADRE
jgi:hypothetical protein